MLQKTLGEDYYRWIVVGLERLESLQKVCRTAATPRRIDEIDTDTVSIFEDGTPILSPISSAIGTYERKSQAPYTRTAFASLCIKVLRSKNASGGT